MSRSLAYPLVGVFFLLAGVPLLFSGLLYGLTDIVGAQGGAAISLYIISFVLLAAFVLCVAFVHALLLSVVSLHVKRKLTMMDAFKGARRMYWKTLALDAILVVLALLIASLVFVNLLWVDVLALVLALIHVYVFLCAPLYLDKTRVFGALRMSAVQVVKRPGSRAVQFLGVVGWSLIPLGLWVLFIRESFSVAPWDVMMQRVVVDWIALLFGQQHVFWLYFASPAMLWYRLVLLVVHVGFLISATLWLARRT